MQHFGRSSFMIRLTSTATGAAPTSRDFSPDKSYFLIRGSCDIRTKTGGGTAVQVIWITDIQNIQITSVTEWVVLKILHYQLYFFNTLALLTQLKTSTFVVSLMDYMDHIHCQMIFFWIIYTAKWYFFGTEFYVTNLLSWSNCYTRSNAIYYNKK